MGRFRHEVREPTDAGWTRGNGRDVATKFEHEQSFTADPVTVTVMLRDPAYVQEKGERTGSHDITVEVSEAADGGVVISSTRSMPADVPSFAAPFVGDTITITEVQTWGPARADGHVSSTITVSFNSPISYSGTIDLSANDSGATALNAGEFKAGVPFIGGKVVRVAAAQPQPYLVKEVPVAAEWLAQQG